MHNAARALLVYRLFAHGQFAPWTFHPIDDSPIDVSPQGRGAKRLWANPRWGEMSSAGRNIHGATKCPYTGRNVHGGTVHWAKSPDTVLVLSMVMAVGESGARVTLRARVTPAITTSKR